MIVTVSYRQVSFHLTSLNHFDQVRLDCTSVYTFIGHPSKKGLFGSRGTGKEFSKTQTLLRMYGNMKEDMRTCAGTLFQLYKNAFEYSLKYVSASLRYAALPVSNHIAAAATNMCSCAPLLFSYSMHVCTIQTRLSLLTLCACSLGTCMLGACTLHYSYCA